MISRSSKPGQKASGDTSKRRMNSATLINSTQYFTRRLLTCWLKVISPGTINTYSSIV